MLLSKDQELRSWCLLKSNHFLLKAKELYKNISSLKEEEVKIYKAYYCSGKSHQEMLDIIAFITSK